MTRLEKLKSLCADNAVRPHGAIVLEPNELAALLALVEQLNAALARISKGFDDDYICDDTYPYNRDTWKLSQEALTAFAAWNENKEENHD